MIGKLTFDKSSKDVNLFLYSIYLIGKYGVNYEIHRNFHDPSFVEIMAELTGNPAYKEKDGKVIEERTLYNKSLYAQYYGFIERAVDFEKKEVLRLTSRGKILYSYIQYDEETKKCTFKGIGQTVFRDLIWCSIVYDSFGSNNDGAQTSFTDIDAPKVIFRTIFDLNGASNEEIFYVLFSLNKGDDGKLPIEKSYQDLLAEVQHNRTLDAHNYERFFNDNGLKNKVGDSKVIDILADPLIGIITKTDIDGIVYNNLSEDCSEYKKDSKLFECWYNPHNLVLHTKSISTTKAWMEHTMLNKTADLINGVWVDLDTVKTDVFHSLIEKHVKDAIAKENRVYLIVTCSSEAVLVEKMGEYLKLLQRKHDYASIKHGCSEFTIVDTSGNPIFFPQNFNFIALIND